MLLKMAYVHEGLNHTGQALYCLNLYYLATKDQRALDKMEALATKFGLEGYKNSDFDRALAAYQGLPPACIHSVGRYTGLFAEPILLHEETQTQACGHYDARRAVHDPYGGARKRRR